MTLPNEDGQLTIKTLFAATLHCLSLFSTAAHAKKSCIEELDRIKTGMEVVEIFFYQTENGNVPFERWFGKLGNVSLQNKIVNRIDNVRRGQWGDYKQLHRVTRGEKARYRGVKIRELRITLSDRVYLGEIGDSSYLVLLGGDKDSQSRDIALAFDLMQERKVSLSNGVATDE